jgi:hypothetical protein
MDQRAKIITRVLKYLKLNNKDGMESFVVEWKEYLGEKIQS